MSAFNEDRSRQVVPLWRNFSVTRGRGELATAGTPRSRFTDELVTELVSDWQEQRTLSFAADLVSVAFSLGRFGPAVDAAEFTIRSPDAPPAAIRIAQQYLAGEPKSNAGISSKPETPDADAPATATSLVEHLRSGVRVTRHQLAAYPRNPVLWCNLSRMHTSLGDHRKADRAMCVALALAPENRYVLRAAARFYLHQGQRDQAHRLLADSPLIRHDTWILAAEIATAASGGKTSRNLRTGRNILEADKVPPFHVSELASAIGTLESLAGNLKVGKRLINHSLKQPADNSIAQAAWVARNVTGLSLVQSGFTGSHEANAWYGLTRREWQAALGEARRWLMDQPFSSRPAILGSLIASVHLDDYETAIQFARHGLLSNPGDFTLQNNLAFALALKGEIDNAKLVIGLIDESQLPGVQRAVITATKGLAAFRSGQPDEGRKLYRAAIESARHHRHHPIECLARIYLAFEELRIGSDGAEAARTAALDAATILTDASNIAVAEKLRNYTAR